MKKENIKDVQGRVKDLMECFGDDIDICNEDGEGIVLDSTVFAKVVGGGREEFNIEVKTVYQDLHADTNLGKINLLTKVKDIDDWYTIEDILKDVAEIWIGENSGEGFQK